MKIQDIQKYLDFKKYSYLIFLYLILAVLTYGHSGFAQSVPEGFTIEWIHHDDPQFKDQNPDIIREIVAAHHEEIEKESGIGTQGMNAQDFETNGFLTHSPNGGYDLPVKPECRKEVLLQEIEKNKNNPKKWNSIYNNFFNKCGDHIGRNSPKGILSLLNFTLIDYDIFKRDNIKAVIIKNSRGEKTPGILALKKDSLKRPLVILKCGVFCSVESSSSSRNYLMSLFDQSPFNVLLLSNRTGQDYIRSNNKITLGGFQEGVDLIEIADWLKKYSPLKKVISSVHLLGVSLGGNAAGVATLYNDSFKESEKPLNSIIPVCSALDLETSMRVLYSKKLVGKVVAMVTKKQLTDAKPYVPEVEHMINSDSFPNETGFPDYIYDLTSYYMKNPETGKPLNAEQFWKSNNFFEMVQKIKTPTLVWGSKDDLIVDNKSNTNRFANDRYTKNEAVVALNVPYGNHCGFSAVYGFPTTTSVLSSFILANSPEFTKNKTENSEIIKLKSVGIKHDEAIINYKIVLNSSYSGIEFQIFSPSMASGCSKKKMYISEARCMREEFVKFDFYQLKKYQVSVPQNAVEYQALTRELNQNIDFKYNGKSIIGTRQTPNQITWTSY